MHATPSKALLLALLVALAAGCGTAVHRPGAETAWPGQVHDLPRWGWGVPSLTVNVPEEYDRGLRSDEGVMVHLFRRPPGEAPVETATLTFWVGRHPRAVRSEAIAEPGRIAGREVTWFGDSWQDDRGQTIYHAETYVTGLFRWPRSWRLDAQGLVVHVMAWGTDQREVERLIEAAGSLRLAE